MFLSVTCVSGDFNVAGVSSVAGDFSVVCLL